VSGAPAQPHRYVAALCLGLAGANLARGSTLFALCAAAVLGAGAAASTDSSRVLLLLAAFVFVGWWWGSARLDSLDRSELLARVDTSERTVLAVTAPARRSRFELRTPAQVRRFGRLRFREAVLLELPLGRSPPQGALIEAVATVRLPRPPKNGFDETTWLRHHGVHVVLHVDRWRMIGRRGGLGGVADRLRALLAGSIAPGLRGDRRGIVEGVVLGDEQSLPEGLRQRFRASGLYHLLAVSGQNVVLVAAGALALAWLLGIPRWLGEMGALGAIAAYVLAVGAQPSVIRAGVSGALVSLAWLAARAADRWHFFLLGALVLLAWNPYTLLGPGFQLSFAAVAGIFLLVPRLLRLLEGYPVPARLAGVIAVSTACGVATAPILWLQFHAVPLLTVPANALAAPAVAPLLALAFAAALAGLISPPAATALAWLNGWCAAYLAACARVIGGTPGAQVRSGRSLVELLLVGGAIAAYAWRRWLSFSPRTSSSEPTARR
jgi:competence protein ComEC